MIRQVPQKPGNWRNHPVCTAAVAGPVTATVLSGLTELKRPVTRADGLVTVARMTDMTSDTVKGIGGGVDATGVHARGPREGAVAWVTPAADQDRCVRVRKGATTSCGRVGRWVVWWPYIPNVPPAPACTDCWPVVRRSLTAGGTRVEAKGRSFVTTEMAIRRHEAQEGVR